MIDQFHLGRFMATFDQPRALLPVIHPINRDAVLANVEIAIKARCKGVFLVNQGADEDDVLAHVLAIRERFSTLWVGVNLLTRVPAAALAYALHKCNGRIDGIWTDNAYIEERQPIEDQPLSEGVILARNALGWEGLYFGGVAFKYQHRVATQDLGDAARIASKYMDVICTSGEGTGIAAEPAKLRTMRRATSAAIALASGVTIDNVEDYLPYVNAYLVGTGIEEKFGVFDRYKVRDLAQAIHA